MKINTQREFVFSMEYAADFSPSGPSLYRRYVTAGSTKREPGLRRSALQQFRAFGVQK